MRCNHPKESLACEFHHNGICTRDHNYECPALVKPTENIPTADVVEVVRCKDCMWYEIYELKKDGTDDRRYKPSFCTLYDRLRDPDWFCADGERGKEEKK